MESGLFREKSMEKISSPEDLHDYMRVTSPRLWMLLAAIALLLAGFIVYASTATMENTIDIRVTVQNVEGYTDAGEPDGKMVPLVSAALPISYKDILETGMTVRIGNEEGRIELIALANTDEGEQMVNLIIIMDNENCTLPDGECDAEVVTETTTPISFLWN